MKKSKNETRYYSFDIRSEENEQEERVLTGVPIVFDAPTDLGGFTEIIERNALDKTDMKDVRLLVNHDTKMIPLARSRNNNENSTMQLFVGDDGLNMRANIDVKNNQMAAAVASAIDRGDLSGMSFMFEVGSDRWEDLDTENPRRYIEAIGKIFEVSAVTFPAYEQTSISARSAEALDSARAALDSVREAERRERLLNDIKAKIEVFNHDN